MKTDTLGRRLPTKPEPVNEHVYFTDNDIPILEVCMEYGIASNDLLFRLGKRKKKNMHSVRMLHLVTQNMKHDGKEWGIVLRRVEEDRLGFLGWMPRNLHQSYELTPAGIKLLQHLHRYHDYNHRDQREHRMMRSTIMGEIRYGAQQNRDFTYTPKHIFTKKNLPEGMEEDGMFSIDYGGVGRVFFLETDRGTEPLTGKHRKTIERQITRWHEFLSRPKGGGPSEYAKHFDTRMPGILLNVTTSEARMRSMMEHQKKTIGDSKIMLYRFDPRFYERTFKAPMITTAHWEGAWERVGHPAMYIKDPS